MKHIKLFEQFNEDHVDEFLGMGRTDASLKKSFESKVNSPAWRKFYLYLGDDEFVRLSEAKPDQKRRAYDEIKKQGEKDKWKGDIGIYGGHDTGKEKFIVYRPSTAISYDAGDTGLPGIGNTGGSSRKMDDFKEIGDSVVGSFEKFIDSKHMHQAA